MTVFLFVCSIVLLMVGHALRLMRWSCFIKIYEHPPAGALLRSMALGYALNFFVPFKLGDVFRAYYSGKRMKNGIGFSLATVILDRFLDLIVVALLFAVSEETPRVNPRASTISPPRRCSRCCS